MNKLLISFSGGRTSALMTKWCLDNWRDKYEMTVVFANTGKEREETLEFVKQCDDEFGFNTIWIEAIINPENGKGTTAKIVTFETAARNGKQFEELIKKYGLPNVKHPICTRELKTKAIHSCAKSMGWSKYYTAIGIRADEIDRISEYRLKNKYLYPLVNLSVTKNDVNLFWSQQSFDLRLKTYEGNCDLCFKKSFRKLMTIVNENPESVLWWYEMEQKYSHFIPESKKHNIKLVPPIHCFRMNKSIVDIVDMAKNKFEPAVDESQYKREHKQLQLWGVDLDSSNGCSESCEVF